MRSRMFVSLGIAAFSLVACSGSEVASPTENTHAASESLTVASSGSPLDCSKITAGMYGSRVSDGGTYGPMYDGTNNATAYGFVYAAEHDIAGYSNQSDTYVSGALNSVKDALTHMDNVSTDSRTGVNFWGNVETNSYTIIGDLSFADYELLANQWTTGYQTHDTSLSNAVQYLHRATELINQLQYNAGWCFENNWSMQPYSPYTNGMVCSQYGVP